MAWNFFVWQEKRKLQNNIFVLRLFHDLNFSYNEINMNGQLLKVFRPLVSITRSKGYKAPGGVRYPGGIVYYPRYL